jgi:putative peptidoglycan lipid II flippase
VLLAASVLLSRALGYVREAVLAAQLGSSPEVDAYRAAFQIPDLLNHFLAAGALSIALVPHYARVREREGEEAAAQLLAVVLGTVGALTVLATALLWWQAGALVRLQFPRFSPEIQDLTTRLTRIVLPAQLFFVTGGIVRAALMARDRFGTQALAPLLYNVGIIAGGLALAGSLGAEGFAWGALVGAFLGTFLIAVLDARFGAGLRLGVQFAPLDPRFRQYVAIALPLMLGATLLTVDEWYDRWFGALGAAGTVADLGYARLLVQLPVAVVGQAIATAALPTLARLWSEGRARELDQALLGALRAGLALAILGAAGAFALAGPIVAFVYQRGAFGADDSERVVLLLRVFSLAVPAWILQQIATRAFYARGDTWRPMLLGTAVALAAIPLYLALGRRHGAPGLAAAGVIGMTAGAALTLGVARRLHGGPSLAGLAQTGLRALAIALAASLVGAGLGEWLRPWGSLAQLAGGGAGLGGVALLGVFAIGDAPMQQVLGGVLRRLRLVR